MPADAGYQDEVTYLIKTGVSKSIGRIRMCKISVVTSVYNCEKYISETINSVLKQTFTDWEFIIIDDCSTDRSGEIIRQFESKDSRIHYYRNINNKGQCENCNRGIQLAKGKYIARLDHDDICYPNRLEKQFLVMEENPDVVLCGGGYDIIENSNINMRKHYAISDNELRFSLLFCNPFIAHSSFFIRKDAMVENSIWYGDFRYAEDFDLLTRLSFVGKIFYMPESIIAYRIIPEQVTQTISKKIVVNERVKIIFHYLDYLNIENDEIIRKAVKGELKTRKDYKTFESVFMICAEKFGISEDKRSIRKNLCVCETFNGIMLKQDRSLINICSYYFSGFREMEYKHFKTVLNYFLRHINYRLRKRGKND